MNLEKPLLQTFQSWRIRAGHRASGGVGKGDRGPFAPILSEGEIEGEVESGAMVHFLWQRRDGGKSGEKKNGGNQQPIAHHLIKEGETRHIGCGNFWLEESCETHKKRR